jgi:type II restriction/modification system DNA methylase subunit YeeA
MDARRREPFSTASPQFDWSAIEPAIFGTLFTRSLDPAQRAKLGAQYTSKEDILLIVEPVLLAPLRREWEHVRQRAQELVQKRDSAATRGAATRADNELRTLLLGFAQRLATIRVLDPACGSGNFLYVALRLLLDLWKEVAIFSAQAGLSILAPLPGLAPSPEQLYGIEINDYAHELAQATVWIGYFQWLHDNGYGFVSEPILKPLDNIKLMDAILAYDAEGRPVEPVWPAAEVIVGNPPFLGWHKLRSELGDSYVDDLANLYKERVPLAADLVCYWYEGARSQIKAKQTSRAGLLATNSIRGGANRTVLQRIKASGDIFWAWSDRDWVLDGASVRVSMVAFDDGTETVKTLNGNPVAAITPDLNSDVDLTTSRRLPENVGIAFIGGMKKGGFDVDGDTAARLMDSSRNPHNRLNSDVIKRWWNGLDLARRDRGMWIIDFGVDTPISEAEKYVLPFEYVREHVKPARDLVRNELESEHWWLHARPGVDLRKAVGCLQRFIVTARVAKHRMYVWIDASVIVDGQLVAFARDDDYFLGVLHSRPHELWSLRLGTSLEDRPRYTPTTTFETFPFPWPPGTEPTDDPRVQAIAAAAAKLVAQRDAWLNPPDLPEKELQKRTLTNLYNARPDWLAAAHRRLDAAVFAAYGWPEDLADEEILARLLALNLARAG